MKLIGLTSGIGAGKSTVSAYLKEKGYPIIDADQIAHDVTEPNSPTLDTLREAFGDEILNKDGTLNRQKLAKTAFASEQNHEILESIVTARTIEIVDSLIEKYLNEYDIAFLDAPLLFESKMDARCDEVWLVTASDETRISRVMQRDNISKEDVIARMANQMPEKEKILRASCVIKNDGPVDDLYRTIDFILR